MIKVEDLIGIPSKKRESVVKCLDNLLTFKDRNNNISPIITGYNWYIETPKSDRIVTFFHIHETENYRKSMISNLEELRYSKNEVKIHGQKLMKRQFCYWERKL